MGYELWTRSRKILDTGELSGEKAYRITISDQEEVREEDETGGNGERMRGIVPRKKQFETITYNKTKMNGDLWTMGSHYYLVVNVQGQTASYYRENHSIQVSN